jgi:hypothetical protein
VIRPSIIAAVLVALMFRISLASVKRLLRRSGGLKRPCTDSVELAPLAGTLVCGDDEYEPLAAYPGAP